MNGKSQIIAVSSGKGGVGKTNICANVGILLSEQGLKVCIVDADHGLANINIILGLVPTTPEFDLFATPENYALAMQHSKYGVDILSSGSGVSLNSDIIIPDVKRIEQLFKHLSTEYDVILVDTAAGINRSVRNYLSVADFVILAITPEPTSLTDSFGLVRAMKDVNDSFEVVTNLVSGAPQANNLYRRFSNAVKKYIGLDISQMGYINNDPFVSYAVLRQLPIVKHRPDCSASLSLLRISQTIARNIHWKRVHPKPITPKKQLPVNPSFIKQQKKEHTSAFDQWLLQFPQFFGSFTDSREERMERFNQFRQTLQHVLNKNADFEDAFIAFAKEVLTSMPEETKDNEDLEPLLVSDQSESVKTAVLHDETSDKSNPLKKNLSQPHRIKTNIESERALIKTFFLPHDIIPDTDIHPKQPTPKNESSQLRDDTLSLNSMKKIVSDMMHENTIDTNIDIKNTLSLINKMNQKNT